MLSLDHRYLARLEELHYSGGGVEVTRQLEMQYLVQNQRKQIKTVTLSCTILEAECFSPSFITVISNSTISLLSKKQHYNVLQRQEPPPL
jgi:hypothetical protein